MKNEKHDISPITTNAVRPLPIENFTIDKETLEHLPPLHRLAAEAAIRDGRWRLVESPKEVKK